NREGRVPRAEPGGVRRQHHAPPDARRAAADGPGAPGAGRGSPRPPPQRARATRTPGPSPDPRDPAVVAPADDRDAAPAGRKAHALLARPLRDVVPDDRELVPHVPPEPAVP